MKHRLAAILILAMTVCSCGIVRMKNAPYYHAGEPESNGYKPEGIVKEYIYMSSDRGPTMRRMIVYFPADYQDSTKRYPVFYLLHGARGYETSWIKKGDVLRITDSLWRENLAEKFILVMPNVNQYNNDRDYDFSRYKDCFESIFEIDGSVEKVFVKDVVEFVDSSFRTIPQMDSRAIAGLSVGGLQSLYISANHPSVFGYVGLFSPMCWTVLKHGPDNNFYADRNKIVDNQFTGSVSPSGYYIYIGKNDIFCPQVSAFSKMLDKRGYDHIFIISKGGHDWSNWKAYYTDMAQRVFKTESFRRPCSRIQE